MKTASLMKKLKMKKELFAVWRSFLLLINLGAQIQDTQTRYTIVNFGLNQPLSKKPTILLSISC